MRRMRGVGIGRALRTEWEWISLLPDLLLCHVAMSYDQNATYENLTNISSASQQSLIRYLFASSTLVFHLYTLLCYTQPPSIFPQLRSNISFVRTHHQLGGGALSLKFCYDTKYTGWLFLYCFAQFSLGGFTIYLRWGSTFLYMEVVTLSKMGKGRAGLFCTCHAICPVCASKYYLSSSVFIY